MLDELLEAWRTNNRINLLLFDAIDDEGMRATLSKRGGRDVAGQFAHLHTVRIMHFERRGKAFAEGLVKYTAKDAPPREELRDALVASGEAVEAFFAAIAEGKAKCMKKGLPTYLSYFVAHDAHHRGNILLTLKECGHAVPKDVRYAIWDWGRR